MTPTDPPPPPAPDSPLLEYHPAQSGTTAKRAAAWLKALGILYAVLVSLALFSVLVENPAQAPPINSGTFFFLFYAFTAILFLWTARQLRRGTQRGLLPTLCAAFANLALLFAAVAELTWTTFSGTVDPGVPLISLFVIMCELLLALFGFAPLIFFLIRLHREKR